ncbi:threonine-phosphate decarboxylase CobD [Azospira restricta]|uniref:threonine-phosphate decarboxylase n=1 Tax=Azospira restricta TaxID=404405 RepID=A0A974SPK1_9RHOO|nr:threonine-phosphate decarboxylase CobD [Azospira restricta]QRJ64133.1 threonine-phosphate decarboxylase [Azospira restricta]
MLEHGGRLRLAAAQWGIPLADWADLSTGINPQGWPVPPLPADCWRRLPEDHDGLEDAAAAYYGNAQLLPIAGSQAAIQCLPQLLPRAAVAMAAPLYAEHPHAWERAGHKVRRLPGASLSRVLAAMTPNVLLCNPNNPSARAFARDELLAAAAQLKKRGGTLVVDEAFADADPDNCVTPFAGTDAAPNLIVLRSLGKFFGLAGARVGFLFARRELRAQMAETLGPWTLSGPSRAVAQAALADRDWQAATRARLAADGERLRALLAPLGEVRANPLFCWLPTDHAQALHDFLAARGILVRLFADLPGLRFGLPGDESEWQRLAAALTEWSPQ